MKRQARKELEVNILADRVGRAITRVRPYSTYIVAGILVVAAAYLFWSSSASSAKAHAEAVWQSVYSLLTTRAGDDPDSAGELAKIADAYPESNSAAIALCEAGLVWYGQAVQTFDSDPEEARVLFEKAADHFKRVVARFPDVALAVQKAQLGLAYVYEATSGGDLAKAKAQFKRVADQYPDTAFAMVALERLQALEEPDAGAFYKAAATQAAATQVASTQAGPATRPAASTQAGAATQPAAATQATTQPSPGRGPDKSKG